MASKTHGITRVQAVIWITVLIVVILALSNLTGLLGASIFGTTTTSLSTASTASTSTTAPPAITVTTQPSTTVTSLRAKDAVQILTHTKFVDGLGYTDVVGEVRNSGSENLQLVTMAATFFDAANNVIDNSTAVTLMDILTPQQKSPFKVISTKPRLNVDHYRIEVSDATFSNREPNRSLKIRGVSGGVNAVNGFYDVKGEVLNNGTSIARFVEVLVTFYDSSGFVVELGSTFTDPSDLDPGMAAPFNASGMNNVPKIASFSVQVQSA